MRQCIWCESDISADGMAIPVLYSRTGPDECDWQCREQDECFDRQVAMQDAISWPEPGTWRGHTVSDVPVLPEYL